MRRARDARATANIRVTRRRSADLSASPASHTGKHRRGLAAPTSANIMPLTTVVPYQRRITNWRTEVPKLPLVSRSTRRKRRFQSGLRPSQLKRRVSPPPIPSEHAHSAPSDVKELKPSRSPAANPMVKLTRPREGMGSTPSSVVRIIAAADSRFPLRARPDR